MKISRFEEIKAWQEARDLARTIYSLTKDLRDYRFKDQITSAVSSIMANIAEGFSRKTNKEFVQFLFIAKGSCAEAQSHLYIALDQKYISKENFNEAYNKAENVAKMLSGFITYLFSQLK